MTWPTAALGDVVEIVMGQAPDGSSYNNQGDGLPLIAGAGDFFEGSARPNKFTTRPTKLSHPGDIVIGIRASIGSKVWSDGEYCLGRGVAALRTTEVVERRFLWHWLTAERTQLESKGRGATFLQVNRADIAALQIALPPLPEQRRIAAILDGVDSLRGARRRAVHQLDLLPDATFEGLFGAGASNFPIRDLGDVVAEGTSVTYGIVQAGPETPGGVPYIRTGDLVDGEIRVQGLRLTSPEIARRFPRSTVRKREIVMSIRATVGTTALVPAELDGANLTQGTARIAPGPEVDAVYLLGFLRSRQAQTWIAAQVKGATFREITLGRLRELPVLVPQRDLQQRFVRAFDLIQSAKLAHQSHLAKLDELFASLQYRAFRGEL